MSTVTGYPQPPEPHVPGGGFYQPTGFLSTPPPKRGMSTGAILGIVAALVAVLCVGAGVAVALTSPEPEAASPRVEVTTTSVPETLPPPTTAPPTTAAAGPLASFGDGTYEVGSQPGQIAPGKYRAMVPADSFGCYWERLKGTSGQFSDIIANNLAEPKTQTIVTIAPTDKAFTSRDCGTWTKA